MRARAANFAALANGVRGMEHMRGKNLMVSVVWVEAVDVM
jgi:hypothetical protein